MPSQHEKLAYFAEHLFDGYLGLREKWALFAPTWSDQDVASKYSATHMHAGFLILRRTLLFGTILDIANLCSDRSKKTPSLETLAKALKDEAFRKHASKRYAEHARLPPRLEDANPLLMKVNKRCSEERMQMRSREFEAKVVQFTEQWDRLCASEELCRIKAARDRVVAHRELLYVNEQYAPVNLNMLGLSFNDLALTVERMHLPIDLAQLLLRSASFDWPSAEAQFKLASHFWTVS